MIEKKRESEVGKRIRASGGKKKKNKRSGWRFGEGRKKEEMSSSNEHLKLQHGSPFPSLFWGLR